MKGSSYSQPEYRQQKETINYYMEHAYTEKESAVSQLFKFNWASWIFIAQSGAAV